LRNWHKGAPPAPITRYITFVPEAPPMDFDTFDTDLWSEIQDAPGEIFDIPELNDEDFNFGDYVNSNIDY